MRRWSDTAFAFAEDISAGWSGRPFRAGPLSGIHLHSGQQPFTDLDSALSSGGSGSDFRILSVAAEAARAALAAPSLPRDARSRLIRLGGAQPGVEWMIGARGDMIGLDPAARRAVHLTTLPLHPADLTAPLRNELVWVASLESDCVMHAAAVGVGGRGVLVLGRGGAGKSTLTVCALAAGWDACGDDYVWVERRPSGYTAHRLYRSVKLDPAGPGARMLGSESRYRKISRDAGRTGYLLHEPGPLRLADRLELVGLVVLDPTGSGGDVRRATAREVLVASGISTVSQQHQGQSAALRFVAELGRSLPGFAIPALAEPERMRQQLAAVLDSCASTTVV